MSVKPTTTTKEGKVMTSQTIPTQANNLPRKAPRKVCFDVIKALIESREAPTDKQLAQLYSQFLPNAPAKAKTPEQWVAKAKGVSDVRYYLNNLWSDGKQLVGTDGHRLHLCPTELPEGFYNTELEPVTVDGKYPEFERSIPTVKSERDWRSVHLSDLELKEPRGVMAVQVLPDTWVNRKYLLATLNGQTSFEVAQPGGANCAIKFRLDNPDLVAVILPIRV